MSESFNARERIWSLNLDDAAEEIASYTDDTVGCAIADVAANWSLYLYAHDAERAVATRADEVADIITSGYSLNSAEFLGQCPGKTLKDYTYYIGCETERRRIEQNLFGNVPQLIEVIALSRLGKRFGDLLDGTTYAAVTPALDRFDAYSHVEDICAAAEEAYAGAMEQAA